MTCTTCQDLRHEVRNLESELERESNVAEALAGSHATLREENEKLRAELAEMKLRIPLAVDERRREMERTVVEAAEVLCAQPMLVKGDAATWGDVAQSSAEGPKLLGKLLAAVNALKAIEVTP